MLIRAMKASDAKTVAEVHTLSWQYAYNGILDQKFLDSIDVQKREQNWRKGIESNDPPLIRLVLERDNQVIAFACGLDNRAKVEIPTCDGELWAIYVHPSWVGQGAGKSLLKHFCVEMKQAGKNRFCLWVLKDNHPARVFYESQGGVLSGFDKEVKIGDQLLTEVAYEFRL